MPSSRSSFEVVRSDFVDRDPSVIVPDVFPSSSLHGGGSLRGLHDIFRGSIPPQNEFDKEDEAHNRGWLRVAYQTGSIPGYIDPSIDLTTAREYYSSHRQAAAIEVVLDKVKEIPRERLHLSRVLGAIEPVYILPDRSLLNQKRQQVETARAFAGKVVAEGKVKAEINGIHFPSARIHGWAHIWNYR